jgi:hypothetical protein
MYRYVMGSGGGLGNLLKASEEFQQTVDWVRYPTSSQTPTVNADSRPDPNGGTTADQVDYTANTGARLMQTVTLKASTQYTFSVHARAVSGTVDFRMRNITLKAAVQKTATTTGPLTNGFTRFTYTFTTGAAGSYELALQNASGTPTARSVIFWGAMLNQGGTALDYDYAAPTTGGSAPAPAYAGFGDAFGGVTAYYSLRQFTEAETLNAIRVRRSSDDTEQDIGFDANGDLDTTALTTFVNEDVNTYTSDFSSTEDLGETNGTGAAAQSIGGVDDAYKFTTITGTGQMFAGLEPFSGKGGGNEFRVQADVYLPSTNAEIDKVRIFTGYGAEIFAEVTTTDAWTSIDQTITITQGAVLRFQAYDGTDVTPTTTEANVFYLKNIVVTQTTADGAVTTFYDQSGNGNHATNSTASEQPLVVSGGTLVEENGKAAIDFDGVNDYLQSSPFTSALVQPNTMCIVANASAISGNDYFYSSTDGSARNDLASFMFAGSVLAVSGASINTQQLRTNIFNGANSENIINGISTTTGNAGIQDYSGVTIGARFDGSDPIPARIQEYLVFNSDQSSNLGTVTTGGGTGIEGNINTYFDIV